MTNKVIHTATINWQPRMVKIGPARSTKVKSCILIRDIAKNVPREMSAIREIEGLRLGQA